MSPRTAGDISLIIAGLFPGIDWLVSDIPDDGFHVFGSFPDEKLYRVRISDLELMDTLPLLKTLTTSHAVLAQRAQAVFEVLSGQLPGAHINIEPADAQIGSGALPDQKLPSLCVSIRGVSLESLGTRLRQLPTPVVGRIQQDALWLDMRGADPLDELITNLRTLTSP